MPNELVRARVAVCDFLCAQLPLLHQVTGNSRPMRQFESLHIQKRVQPFTKPALYMRLGATYVLIRQDSYGAIVLQLMRGLLKLRLVAQQPVGDQGRYVAKPCQALSKVSQPLPCVKHHHVHVLQKVVLLELVQG